MAEPLRVACERKEFQLAVPLRSARGVWQRRASLQLRLSGAHGPVGRGEASPLPGYSPDELESVQSALAGLELDELSPATPAALVQQADALLPPTLPAARFALQTALLERHALTRRRPLWSMLQELLPDCAAPARVPLCGLLASSEPAVALSQAEQLYAAGIRCFKVKIGPGQLLPQQAQLLAELRERWGMATALRLDANGSLAAEALEHTCAELARFQPELVEEPLPQPCVESLATLPFDWALDESLQGMSDEQVAELCQLPRCRALVLKLTTLGGFGTCAALAASARRNGKLAIVSHALEGPLAWLASAHFALALRGSAAGLWPRADGNGSSLFAAGALQPPAAPGLGWAE